jgi:4-amino-4-deoxy-L-arabinose transferase-like glycosyltransferase
MGRLSGGAVTLSKGNVWNGGDTGMAPSAHAKRDSLLIFLGGLILFTFSPIPEFISFQTRFALLAQEMLRNGPTFFPTLYGRPYPDYPATSTFLIYLASLPFGRVIPVAAVLPTAIASAGILAVTYRIGAMRSRYWGFAAALLSLLTVEFLRDARTIAVDQYVSLAVVLSFYLAYSADHLGRRTRLWLLAPVWAAGFAFRGPMGLVLPAVVVCSYYLWHKRLRPLAVAGVSSVVLLALCLAGLLAAARLQGGESFVEDVFKAQMVGRMHDRGPGVEYYWLGCFASYAIAFPLAVIAVVSRLRDILRRANDDDKLLGSLAVWVLVLLAGMSIPEAKKMRYILPIAPAISLMASYVVVQTYPRGILRETKRWLLRSCFVLPAAAAVGVLAFSLWAWRVEPSQQTHYLGALCTLALVIAFLRKLHDSRDTPCERDLVLLASAAVVFAVVTVGIVEPICYSREKTRPFVSQVEALEDKDPGPVVFFRVGPDAEDIKFMANLSKPCDLRFADSLDAPAGSPGTPYVITTEKVFDTIAADDRRPMRVLVRGKIGHKDFVVLTLGRPQDG